MPNETLTISEASKAYGVPVHAIRYLINKGKLPARQEGEGLNKRAPLVFSRADIEKALEGKKNKKSRRTSQAHKAQEKTDPRAMDGVMEELKAMRKELEMLKQEINSLQQEVWAATPQPGESILDTLRRIILR